jgi:beta-xylosidase
LAGGSRKNFRVNDWPVIGVDTDGDGKGEPVSSQTKPNVGRAYPIAAPQTSDEFSRGRYRLQWQWSANYQAGWFSVSARRGWLRLFSEPLPATATNLWPAPNLILQKLPAPAFTVTTKLEASHLLPGQKAGLIMMGMDYSYLAIEKTASGFRLIKASCHKANEASKEITEADVAINSASMLLRVEVTRGALCHFSYSIDGKSFTAMGTPFTAREGRWIGAKVGLFSLAPSGVVTRGYVEVDWFRFE